jgi:hypothetical protein
MDENPYKSPQARAHVSPRLSLWDVIAAIGVVIYTGSIIVRSITEDGTSANEYARIGREISGLTLVAWSFAFLVRKFLGRHA